MKKGRVSLIIGIVLLVLGLCITALGVLRGLGVMPTSLSGLMDTASIYLSLKPGEYGLMHFGLLTLILSIIVLSFRMRKPYSMFLPVYLVGVYMTLGVFLRLCYSMYVPEALFVTLKDQSAAVPLMFLLLVIEGALMVVLLIATKQLDASWRKKREITRKKLEAEGVLVSKEDVIAQKEKARIDKDNALIEKKLAKEERKLEKERAKAEKLENKKRAKYEKKDRAKYEKERDALERKKEDQEDREERKLKKEADRKAYLLSVENDKENAKKAKEDKKKRKEEKKRKKLEEKEVELESTEIDLPDTPANPNTPLLFPNLPEVTSMPRFASDESDNEDVEEIVISRPEIADDDYVERGPRPESTYFISQQINRFDTKAKHYKAGGMLEATLEMMNSIPEDKMNVSRPNNDGNRNLIIGYDEDEKQREEKDVENVSSIAPSNLPPSHPRYKMFESLKYTPTEKSQPLPEEKEKESAKFAPSSLSPDHPRYKMFESLQNNSIQNVSSFPSRAFQPEEESSPTVGQFQPEPRKEERVQPEVPLKSVDKFASVERFESKRVAKATIATPVVEAPPEPEEVIEEDEVDSFDEPIIDNTNSDDTPEQTESLDLTVGIGGLVSNNAGYRSIMNRSKRNYTAPPISLLKDYPAIGQEIDERTRRLGEVIVETYAQQRTMVELSAIIKGPTVTMFELTLEPGTLISRITSRENELSYALGGKHVRILAPIPGKQAVGIEVPNEKTSIVGFKDMVNSLRRNEKYLAMKVPMILGRTIMGEPIVIDVAKMPHMIIAGTTGSGKSVCINAFINTLIYQKSPSEVRLILVDPKVVELTLYNGIPHLLTPVITDAKKVVKMLNFLVEEMERRYAMLARYSVRNIVGYNQKIEEEHIAAEKMPYIVLIMDEFADMMSVVAKEIETQISRLAAKARAAGIHLILATQRPSSDVITGTIKSNLPARIAFAVSSGVNSRVILDEGGAENLLGKGDMLLMDPSCMGLKRIQGAFLSDSEVDLVVAFAKKHGGEPDYLDDAIFEEEEEVSSDGFGDGPVGDENSDEYLFEVAKQIVYEKKSASASYLQRRMKIGYNRAARLIEMMEERGIVGPQNGSKPREILKFE